MDIYCPNFDHFLELKLENISENQIGLLEPLLQTKIRRYGSRAIGYMNLTEKVHLLSIGFGSHVIIAVEDPEKGIDSKVFKDVVKAETGKIKNSQLLEKLQTNAVFIQTDKQVMESLVYMGHVQTTEIYNLIKLNDPREKSAKELKFKPKQEVQEKLVTKLIQYESLKRRVLEQFNLNQPKFYGLLYFYKGERLCKDFYDRQFQHAYSKSRADLSKGLAELYRTGHLSKRGTTRGLTYSITSKGIDLLIKVLNKLLYDV